MERWGRGCWKNYIKLSHRVTVFIITFEDTNTATLNNHLFRKYQEYIGLERITESTLRSASSKIL